MIIFGLFIIIIIIIALVSRPVGQYLYDRNGINEE